MLGWNNIISTLNQRYTTLFRRCSTLFRRCFNFGHWRCINVVERWKSDIGFSFIFNVGSMLFQRSSTTLKQRWSDVEMLAGETWNWRRIRKVWIYELIKTWLYTEIVLWVAQYTVTLFECVLILRFDDFARCFSELQMSEFWILERLIIEFVWFELIWFWFCLLCNYWVWWIL